MMLLASANHATIKPAPYLTPSGKTQLVANYGESIFAQPSLNTYAAIVITESNAKAAGKNRL